MERRILGKENLRLIDGSKKEVNIYAVKLSEKNHITRKHRTKMIVGTGKDKSVDTEIHDDRIIEDILNIAFNGEVLFDDLDFGEDWVYSKYFNPNNYIGVLNKTQIKEQIEKKERELEELRDKLESDSKNCNMSEQ